MATGPSTNGADPALYNVVASLREEWITTSIRGDHQAAQAIERRYHAAIAAYVRRIDPRDADTFLGEEQIRVHVEYLRARGERGRRTLWRRIGLTLLPGASIAVLAVLVAWLTAYRSPARLIGVSLEFVIALVWFVSVIVVLRRTNALFVARVGPDLALLPDTAYRRLFSQADRTIYLGGVLCLLALGYAVIANLPPGLLHR